MKLLERLHERHIYQRRIGVLAAAVAELLPSDATVLDVGAGDGAVAEQLLALRPDLDVRGLDVLLRPGARIPIEHFDGLTIPIPDRSVDAIIVVDVIHHATDPSRLLAECLRVARNCVVIKDHLAEGFVATSTLRFMDRVGRPLHSPNCFSRALVDGKYIRRVLRGHAVKDLDQETIAVQ